MINPFTDTNWNPDRAERRKFAKSLIIGFPIVAAAMAVAAHLHGGGWKPGFLWLGAMGCLAGMILWLLPGIARPFYLVWYFVACCIGIVMGNLLVTAFFFLAITPAALIMRLVGRDPLKRQFDPQMKSYWREAQKVVDPERYFRQF